MSDPVAKIVAERERHFNLFGSEGDIRHAPNDWLAIIGRYIFEEAHPRGRVPDRASFEDSLVKAAAVIVAALEHAETMQKSGLLS